MSVNKFQSENPTPNPPGYPSPNPPGYQTENPVSPEYDQTTQPGMSRPMSVSQTPPQHPAQYDPQQTAQYDPQHPAQYDPQHPAQYDLQHPAQYDPQQTAQYDPQRHSQYQSNTAVAVEAVQGSPGPEDPVYVRNENPGVPTSASNIFSDGTKRKLSNFVEAVTDDIRSRIESTIIGGLTGTNDRGVESNMVMGGPGTPQANVNNGVTDNNAEYHNNTVSNSRKNSGPDPRMSMTNKVEVNNGQTNGQTNGPFSRSSVTGALPPVVLMNNAVPGSVPFPGSSIANSTMPIPGETSPRMTQVTAGPNTVPVTQRNSFTANMSPSSAQATRASVSPNIVPISRNSVTNNVPPNVNQMSRNSVTNANLMMDGATAQRNSQVNNIIREASQILRDSQAALIETSPQIIGIRNSVSAPPDAKLFRLSEEKSLNGKNEVQFQTKRVTLNLNEIVAKSDGKKLYLEIPLDADGRVVAAFTPTNATTGSRWKSSTCQEIMSQRKKCNKPCYVRREKSAENTQSNECYDPCSGESNQTADYTDTYSEKNSKSLNTASEGFTSGDECVCSNSMTVCRKKNKEEVQSPRERISQTFLPSCCHDCTPKRDSCANICCCHSCADSTESSDGCVSEYSTECVEVSCSNDLLPGTVVSTKRKITRKCVQFRAGNSEDCVSESGSPV